MLRINSLFRASASQRGICLLQCGKSNPKPANDEKASIEAESLRQLTHPRAAKLLAKLMLANKTYKDLMVPRLFNRMSYEQLIKYLMQENCETLTAIFQQADDFNALMEKFPQPLRGALSSLLFPDFDALQAFLKPLSGKNQRQLLDYLGVERIMQLSRDQSTLTPQSEELLFYLTNKMLNEVVTRKNRDNFYTLRQREISAGIITPRRMEL